MLDIFAKWRGFPFISSDSEYVVTLRVNPIAPMAMPISQQVVAPEQWPNSGAVAPEAAQSRDCMVWSGLVGSKSPRFIT